MIWLVGVVYVFGKDEGEMEKIRNKKYKLKLSKVGVLSFLFWCHLGSLGFLYTRVSSFEFMLSKLFSFYLWMTAILVIFLEDKIISFANWSDKMPRKNRINREKVGTGKEWMSVVRMRTEMVEWFHAENITRILKEEK